MKGFTLVEMLVALAVFGLLAAAGVAVLGQAVDTQGVVRGRMDELGQFQRLRAILKTDLEQAAIRRTRDEAGRRPPVFAGGGDGPLLAFVRRGWDNPDAAPRASLQRVEYRLAEGRLERQVRSALDGAAAGEPLVLLQGVTRAEVAFLIAGEWLPVWTPTSTAPLPEAVRLELAADGVGEVRQLFLTPGAFR